MRNKKIYKLNIYGTLGPSCADKSILIDMFRAGMTGIRLNLSHCTLPDREDWLAHFYEASDELHILPDFLVDLQGPELRIGQVYKPLILKKDDLVDLVPLSSFSTREGRRSPSEAHADTAGFSGRNTTENDRSSSLCIPCPDILFSSRKEGEIIKLDDGKIRLTLVSIIPRDSESGPEMSIDGARCRVLTEGVLTSGKSIAIEGLSVPLPSLTDQDREMIRLLGRYRVTGVMQPFVRTKDDLIALREELAQAGLDHVKVFAKIETEEGADHLMDFLPYCDEVVIARGDLGNAIPLPRLPVVQKQLSSICRMARKPFMVVTQMLASMEENPLPSRAEVSDIANAVLDGASSIMLTGETAAGKYPVEAMEYFCRTAFEAHKYLLTGERMF